MFDVDNDGQSELIVGDIFGSLLFMKTRIPEAAIRFGAATTLGKPVVVKPSKFPIGDALV